VRHCHERYDGAGYPDRLAGRRDPDRVADHPRLRRLPRDDDRPAVSQAVDCRRRRLRRLHDAAGTQFDPRVVDVCARVLASRGAGASPSAIPSPR
jgi:hypothetical protein